MYGFHPEKFKDQPKGDAPKLGFKPRKSAPAEAAVSEQPSSAAPGRGFRPGMLEEMAAPPSVGLGFRPGMNIPVTSDVLPGLGFKPFNDAVRAQAQNQAPDSIPAMVKPGEFVLPPDTVHAMGGAEALQGVVDATHTPAPEAAIVPRGFKPRAYFADGGMADDDWNKPTMPYREQMRSVGQALMNVPKHIVSAPGYGLNSDMQRPGETSEAFAQRRTGPSPQDAPAPAAPGTPAAPNPTDQRLAAGTQAAPMGLAAAALASPPPASSPPPAASPATPDNQVMPGVFNHGRGQYSDQAGGMGMPSTFTGQPNQQNLNAAQRLSDGQGLAARAMQQQAQQPGFSGVIGQQGGNGNMWSRTPEQQRRDAEVQASSIHRPTAQRGMAALKSLDAESLEGVRGANALAQEAMRGQSGLAQEAMRQDGGLQREGMQQGGANRRSMVQAMLEQQRINQAGETAGVQNRGRTIVQALQEQIATEQDPARRQSIVQRLREIQGQAQPAEWGVQVTPTTKNVDGSTTQGSIIRFNKATGQTEVVSQGQGGAQLPPGMTRQVGTSGGKPVYEDAQGNRFVAG